MSAAGRNWQRQGGLGGGGFGCSGSGLVRVCCWGFGGLRAGDGVVVVGFGECECLVGDAELGNWYFGWLGFGFVCLAS